MRIGDKFLGKVIDKFVIYDRLELVIENSKKERIIIHPDDENDWEIVTGDKVRVKKISNGIYSDNIKISRLK